MTTEQLINKLATVVVDYHDFDSIMWADKYVKDDSLEVTIGKLLSQYEKERDEELVKKLTNRKVRKGCLFHRKKSFVLCGSCDRRKATNDAFNKAISLIRKEKE